MGNKDNVSLNYMEEPDILNLFDEESPPVAGDECPICMDSMKDKTKVCTHCCLHTICLKCYVGWRRNNESCPVCRTEQEKLPVREHVEIVVQPNNDVVVNSRRNPTMTKEFILCKAASIIIALSMIGSVALATNTCQ